MAELVQPEICIVILIGLPASGKTTLCKALKDFVKTEYNLYNVIHICYDDMISVDALKCSDDVQWKEARKVVLHYVKEVICFLRGLTTYHQLQSSLPLNILHQIKEEVSKRIYICVDDNMYYRSMRYEYYQIARSYNSSFTQIYIKCNVTDALHHNSLRDNSVPSHIIKQMLDKLESPDNGSIWENFSLTVFSEKWTIEKLKIIVAFLNNAINFPVLPKKDDLQLRLEAKDKCSRNLLHQIDVILRKIVGDKIKEARMSGCKSVKQLEIQSKCLADKRHKILSEIKRDHIKVPNEIASAVEECHPQKEREELLKCFLSNLFLNI